MIKFAQSVKIIIILLFSFSIYNYANAYAGFEWTLRNSASQNGWRSATYGNGLFVVVASFGNDDLVMTSPGGITWTSRKTAVINGWWYVTYGNGLFVAVSINLFIAGFIFEAPV